MASALVREGTQNSADARSGTLQSHEPVRIRIHLSGANGALDPRAAARWSDGIWTHLRASDSGLRDVPSPDEPCTFLVFEDFGTTGLTGDTSSDDACTESFYSFFRAENTSTKTSGTGGSWGVGKTAFPLASRANAFFALTTRETDRRTVLMGSLTLRTRHVDGTKYTPDSWFGVAQPRHEDGGVIQPIEDPHRIADFSRDFLLSRSGESGTSIVVPWCHEIGREEIIRAVIDSNFDPIIAGAIEVTISSSDREDLRMTSETIECALSELRLDHQGELRARMRLASWSRREGDRERVLLQHGGGGPSVKWDQFTVTSDARERLRRRFEEGAPIAVRAPIPMAGKANGTFDTSHLDILLQRTESGLSARPIFIRGGVVVPDHKIRRVQGAVAIIRAMDDPLGNLLRAAEDPGHKEWSTETRNFAEIKASVKYAPSYLALAREAAHSVCQLLQDPDAIEDIDVLRDVFSLPRPRDAGASRGGVEGRPSRTRSTRVPLVSPMVPPRLLRVTKSGGGFSISRADPDSPTPRQIRIRAAYDVRTKNPFKQWEPPDFEFGVMPLWIARQEGVKVVTCEENRIVLDVINADFEFGVEGFDTERGDLIVDVRPEGRRDD